MEKEKPVQGAGIGWIPTALGPQHLPPEHPTLRCAPAVHASGAGAPTAVLGEGTDRTEGHAVGAGSGC